MTSELERLRQKYGATGGGEVFDPIFRQVADGQFRGDRRKLPYSDVATFMGLPYLAGGVDAAGFGELEIAVLGVPMDLGVTNRAGCRLGPRAVRQVERIGPFEHGLGVSPAGMVRAADIGDVPFRSRSISRAAMLISKRTSVGSCNWGSFPCRSAATIR